MNRLILLVESRIRGDVYVRFGGELPKTHRSNTAGRWMLSLPCFRSTLPCAFIRCVGKERNLVVLVVGPVLGRAVSPCVFTTIPCNLLVVHEAWGGGCFGILPLLVPGKVSHNAEAAVFIV